LANKTDIDFEKLSGFKLVKHFKKLISEKLEKRSPAEVHPSELDPKRQLFAEDYFLLLLFALYNPIVNTMRGIVASSRYHKVQELLDCDYVSLGSFSEAQHVFDPELLRGLFKELSQKVPFKPKRNDARLEVFIQKMIAVDGTFFDALPRMFWATYRTHSENHKVKLHLMFEALRGGIVEAEITPGNVCERKALKKLIEKNRLYVGDRYYGLEYDYFSCFIEKSSDYLFRVRKDCQYEILEEFEINEQSKEYGIVSDLRIKLNGSELEHRLVVIQRDGKTFLLLTNRFDIEADVVGMLYRNRWEVELFFKWLKSILKCSHFLVESPAGVKAQIYAALVLALLLCVATGKKPTKRQMEAIQMYMAGWVNLEELQQVLMADS